MTADSIRLHPQDPVVIALQDLYSGTALPGHWQRLMTAVKRGHRFALADFAAGDKLLREGQITGQALELIKACAHA